MLFWYFIYSNSKKLSLTKYNVPEKKWTHFAKVMRQNHLLRKKIKSITNVKTIKLWNEYQENKHFNCNRIQEMFEENVNTI